MTVNSAMRHPSTQVQSRLILQPINPSASSAISKASSEWNRRPLVPNVIAFPLRQTKHRFQPKSSKPRSNSENHPREQDLRSKSSKRGKTRVYKAYKYDDRPVIRHPIDPKNIQHASSYPKHVLQAAHEVVKFFAISAEDNLVSKEAGASSAAKVASSKVPSTNPSQSAKVSILNLEPQIVHLGQVEIDRKEERAAPKKEVEDLFLRLQNQREFGALPLNNTYANPGYSAPLQPSASMLLAPPPTAATVIDPRVQSIEIFTEAIVSSLKFFEQSSQKEDDAEIIEFRRAMNAAKVDILNPEKMMDTSERIRNLSFKLFKEMSTLYQTKIAEQERFIANKDKEINNLIAQLTAIAQK
jgi:hypothetical protein